MVSNKPREPGSSIIPGYFICQSQYTMDILKKHGMEKCDTVSTQIATTKLDADLQGTPVDQTKHRNADHAGCNDDCQSTSRGIQFLGDKLVSWSSKKQDCTAISSAETEYLSLSACCAQVIWMRTQLLDYRFHFNKIPIYCDSKSAIAISCNPVPDTEDTIKFMLDTQQFTYTVDMFRDTLHLPVETPENPFVAPANIHTIEAFMNRVGYQGVVDKDGQASREDDFHSHHDEHQDDDAPLEGEKRVKRSKMTKRSNQHQEWDAWEKENVVDEDEAISKDVTPELIAEFQNVNKRVPTIFDHARMEATLRDSLSNLSRNAEENPNEPPRPLYNKDLFFLKYGNTEEKKYILSLHKIHAEEFPEPDLEENLN
ncbi:hypothetical protein Tco_0127516 [Tanacetum coccineum]